MVSPSESSAGHQPQGIKQASVAGPVGVTGSEQLVTLKIEFGQPQRIQAPCGLMAGGLVFDTLQISTHRVLAFFQDVPSDGARQTPMPRTIFQGGQFAADGAVAPVA